MFRIVDDKVGISRDEAAGILYLTGINRNGGPNQMSRPARRISQAPVAKHRSSRQDEQDCQDQIRKCAACCTASILTILFILSDGWRGTAQLLLPQSLR
jgi:hypothetical protein